MNLSLLFSLVIFKLNLVVYCRDLTLYEVTLNQKTRRSIQI
jgi:hypothetical protein